MPSKKLAQEESEALSGEVSSTLHRERKNDEGETEPSGQDYTERMPGCLCFLSLYSPLEMKWEAHLWAVKPLSSQAAGCLNNSLKTREVCTPSSDAQPDTLARVCESVSSAFLWQDGAWRQLSNPGSSLASGKQEILSQTR